MSDHIHDYNSIKVLNGLSGIRKKLGMYIGSTSSIDGVKMPKAILQIIQELLSNSLDEVSLMKEKSTISLIVDSNENSIEINDFGRGIPKGPGDSFSEVKHAFTVPHSSGKFDQKAYGSMGTAGMHGIGIKAVNAASKMMQIEAITRVTFLDDKKQIQTDHKKKVKYSLTFNQDQIVESSQEEIKDPKDEIQTGSKIKAYLDDGLIDDTSDQVLFNDLIWNFNEIEEMLKLNVALVPNAIIDFTFIQSSDQALDQSSAQASNEIHKAYSYDNGILSYAQELIGESDQYIYFKSDMFEYHRKSFQYDVVFKYDDESRIYSYANTVKTPLGGSHQNAILNALVSSIQNYAKQTNKSTKTLKKKLILDSLDVLVHAQIDNSIVTFEGQTKDLLSTPLAEKAIFENASTTLLDCLYDNPTKADQLIDQLIEKDKLNNAKAKVEKSFKEASKQLNKKTKLSVLSKLKAASSKNPEEKELYIVEGDSASNIGRDTKTQAVFPIRGKIKNVYELPIDQALKNKEVSTIIAAIGAGVGTEFELDKMQYHKIILACFSGDTKVKCLDGNSYSFEELVDKGQKEIWTYAKNKNGNVVPALGQNIRVTGEAKQLLKITLDNGKSFKSTLDHYLMDAEGQYHQAQEYKVGDSLMPLYTRINEDGREEYYDQNTNSYKLTYRMVAENVLRDERKEANKRLLNEEHGPTQHNIQVHHKDFDKLNNLPENLMWVTAKEHFTQYNPDWSITYNGSEKHLEDIQRAKERGAYEFNSWKYTYNGTEKHLEDMRKARERGDYDKTGWAYSFNNTKAHHDTIVKVNKSKKHIDSVKTSNILVGVKFLQDNNLPFDEYHYDFYRHVNSPYYKNLLNDGLFDSLEEIYEQAKDFPSRDYKQAHSYTFEYDNKKKQRNQIAKVIRRILDDRLKFNRKNYTEYKGSRTVSYDNILKWFDSYEEALEYGKNYNHKIVKIEVLNFDEPVKVYCMNVQSYHNFVLDSGVVVKNCDMDIDGFHLRTLLCGLFAKLFPGIIEAGRLYAVNPPLYKVITYQNGKPNIEMIYSEEEMRHYKMPKNAEVERYKGLGEMELDEAKIALANPETRQLTKYRIDDEQIVEETFDRLLGKNIEGRRKWAFDLNFDDDVAE